MNVCSDNVELPDELKQHHRISDSNSILGHYAGSGYDETGLNKSWTVPVLIHEYTGGRVPIDPAKRYHDTIVMIPAFNEEITIGSVIIGCKKYVDKVVVVNDGSKDRTAELALLAGAEVVSHRMNQGYGRAIRTCFEAARYYRAEIMVILDGDGQHSPDDIPALVEGMKKNGADIIIGSRFTDNADNKVRIPAYRKIGMKILDGLTRFVSHLNITDSQSGFRAYSKKAIHAIQIKDTGMGAGSEILIEAVRNHLKIAEAPINVRYDIGSTSSMHPLFHGLSVVNTIITHTWRKKAA